MTEFTRTACSCPACVECCQRQPGPLAPGDMEKIAEWVGQPVNEVMQYFWASPGALVQDVETGRRRMIPTITPKIEAHGCTFLVDNRCVIHPVAPFGCSKFDTHQRPAEYVPRAAFLYRSIEDSDVYARQRGMLPPATSWKPRGR